MGKRYYCKKENDSGFTLIELLIAIAIASLLIGALSNAFLSQHKTFDAQEQVTEMIQDARATMDVISREAKMAGYNPTGAVIVGVPYSATQLQIRADLNGDGETDGTASNDDTNEEIIYTYDGTNKRINRDTGGGAQPLAENIQSFTFQYYDADGNTTTTAADIRQIELTITARTSEPDPNYEQNSGYRTYTLSSYITPRNLGR